MKKKLFILLFLALVLSGCTEPVTQVTLPPSETLFDPDDLISDRDAAGTYEENGSILIRLEGTAVTCADSGVRIDGTTVTISREGTYVLRGSLENGMLIIDADKSHKVQLVLDGASLHCDQSAAIYVRQADKVFITLSGGSTNILSSGERFTAIDENNIDAAIFSKDDLTLNGSGSLLLSSPGGHGIVSKDDLVIAGGSYQIDAASHGLSANNSIACSGCNLTIVSGKDGMQAEHDEDTSLGNIYIQDGIYTITADGDGISAGGQLQIDGGSFTITTGGGSENGETHSSGMGPMGGGRPGGWGGSSTTTEENTVSTKGLKATGTVLLNGGTFTLNCADDGIHANTDVQLYGGTFTIATGDDGIHADETLAIYGGTVNITESYEGLEGLHIKISSGDIHLIATDDGINAAGGTDQSGFGGTGGGKGGRPGDRFGGGMGGNSSGSIEISGGSIYMQASGDGIDANGYLLISGGHTVVTGPISGDTAILDYDTTATITGGTFIGTGSINMAQSFSQTEQGIALIRVGSQQAGSTLTLEDAAGNTVISFTPPLPYSLVILCSPDIISGQEYTFSIGENAITFDAG